MHGFQSNVEGDRAGLSKGKLVIIPLQLSVQGLFTVNDKLIPYVEGGLGYYITRFTIDSSIVNRIEKVKNAFGLHAGVGFTYCLQKNIAVSVNAKYCLVKTSGTWRFFTAQISGDIPGINLNSFLFATGVLFLF